MDSKNELTATHIESNSQALAVPAKLPKRVPQLDFLRGIAIIFVMGNHAVLGTVHPTAWESALFRPLVYFGWSGVDLFFVLSGFLISGLIFTEFKKTGDFHPGRFLIRRAFKIWPAYYLFLLLTLPGLAALHIPMHWPNVLGELFFLQSYIPTTFWLHTWSLAVEEHFYLCLALLMFFMIRQLKGVKAVPYLCFAIMVMSLVCRISRAQAGDLNTCPSHLRADALAFGVLLGYCHSFLPERLKVFAKPRITAIIGVLLVTGGVWFHPRLTWFGFTYGLSLVYLGFGFILAHLMYSPWRENWFLRIFSTIGVYSYSIYLWQPPCDYLAVVTRLLLEPLSIHLSMLAQVSVFAYLAIFLGIGMAKVVEFPMLRLRDHIFPPSVPPDLVLAQQKDVAVEEPSVPAPEPRDEGDRAPTTSLGQAIRAKHEASGGWNER
jgi:peptidoglycan/LPS O-acetylase OafA/YrhL